MTNPQKNPVESWETEFRKWYVSIYPASWKAHVVIAKINELLDSHHDQLLAEVLESVKIKKEEKWAEMKKSGLELYPETAVMLTEEEIRSILLAKKKKQ